jgi:ribonuclease BN (tRNA processing enzyme)
MANDYTLTFLGVGAGLSPELGNNNVLIENTSRTANLLVDCGPVTAFDLKLAGTLASIQNVFITHVHDDHAGGLALWAQMNRYVYKSSPVLYFMEDLYDELWQGSLRGSLERVQTPSDHAMRVGLDAYFTPRLVKAAESVEVKGLPSLSPRRSLHIEGKPSYGFFLGEDVFYSSDTQELPPATGPTGKPLRAIFQDCQFFETGKDVHTPFAKLSREMPDDLKAITYLMHYNHPPTLDACAHGFRGFVKRQEPIRL